MRRFKKLPKGQKLLAKPPNTSGIETKIEVLTTFFYCPFCLHKDYLFRFERRLPSGKVSKRYTCPECDATMRQDSLTKKQTPEEYAEWVYHYSCDGFWFKVDWKKFNKRLQELGIARRFWDKYKQLKGDKTETYAEHMDKAAEQDMEDQWAEYNTSEE